MPRKGHHTHQKRTKTGRFTKRHDKGHGHYSKPKKKKKKTGFLGLW